MMAWRDSTTRRHDDPELRFWALFAVVMALLTQIVFPPQVMAAQTADGPQFVLCTAGIDSAPIADPAAKVFKTPHKGLNGLKCADCLMATVTAIATPVQVYTPAVYVMRLRVALPHKAVRVVQARAPPRPHSCGPPVSVRA